MDTTPLCAPKASPGTRCTWHVDDVDWTPLTGLFIQKAGYKTVVPPEFTGGAYSIELTTVGPGGSSPTHVEPWAHVFYVLAGHGEVTVEDEIKEVVPGSVSPIAAGQAHSFRNLGETPLDMLVIYHPPRKRKPISKPDRLTVRIESMAREANGVMSLELVATGSEPLPEFDPGAHIDLYLPGGLARSYSLCGQTPGRYRLGIQRDRNSRGGSNYIHDELRVGASLEISTPRNNFPLDETAEQSLFVAGGIGITPILSMLCRMRTLGRSVSLLYAARTRADAAFIDELNALGIPITWHFDDEAGTPPDIEAFLLSGAEHAQYYACGPSGMLDTFEQLCIATGRLNIHVERFHARTQDAMQNPQEKYLVRLEKSGIDIEVKPGQKLLDAILQVGVALPHSCREGVCGTCRTRVLEGRPDHKDSVLNHAQRDDGSVMMPCVSGSLAPRLVLDL